MDSEYIKSTIISMIEKNSFSSKEELIEYLRQLNNGSMINEEMEKIKFDILKKFDEMNKPVKSYTIEEVKSNDKEFIKYTNENGITKILDDNVNKKTLEEQLNQKENELTDLDKDIKKAEKDIFESMANEKVEISFDKINYSNELESSKNNMTNLKILDSSNISKNKEILGNAENNIFFEKESGETYKVQKNIDGDFDIKSPVQTEEIKNEQVKEKTYETVNKSEVLESKEKDFERNIFQDFTDKDLNDLLNFGSNSLSFEQRDQIENELKQRQINTKDQPLFEKQKVKIKVLEKEYNGFSSLLTLSLITGLGGISIFMYILMMIGG